MYLQPVPTSFSSCRYLLFYLKYKPQSISATSTCTNGYKYLFLQFCSWKLWHKSSSCKFASSKNFLSNIFLGISTFLIAKIVVQEYHLVKLIISTYLFFFIYKYYDAKTAMLAKNKPIARTFLSNIFFAVFAFLIAKIIIQGQ